MTSLGIDTGFIIEFLTELLNIPSPTGYTEAAIAFVESALRPFPLALERTKKGALAASWPGRAGDKPRAVTAHVDTLGAMVKEVKTNGRLKLTKVGGFAWNTVEGEGVSVLTASGKTFRGAFLPVKASSHIFGAAEIVKQDRSDDDTFEVRLDERVKCEDDTLELGIQVGDFVAFDPRVEVGPSGFIRSRHLDDKAGVAALVGAVKAVADAGATPAQRTTILVSNYEEVGHGAASGFPPDLSELLTVDMAVVGEGQNSDEFSVGVCVKDSGGPYHIEMRRKITRLAEAAGIPYRLDIYPYYGSDGEAYWRAGGDVMVGLIGPGVDASHSYERTHTDGLVHTARLIAEYLVQP